MPYPVTSDMPSYGASPISFPAFRGATRRLILLNLIAFFLLLILGYLLPAAQYLFHFGISNSDVIGVLSFAPSDFLHGLIWEPFTYSLVHPTLFGTLFELLSLWFVAGFLEGDHNEAWVSGLYWASVLGTAASALALYVCGHALGFAMNGATLTGCFGGIFGMLAAIGLLHGDTEFLLFFLINIKARYLVIIYALVAVAMLFSDQKVFAFSQLGGALTGLIWASQAPRRGFGFKLSESWYGLRNRYYRWKRRRAARKFQVYMKQHGRTVRFDGNGRQIHDDGDDKSRWN